MQVALPGARDLGHGVKWNGIQPVLDAEHQRLDNGQGQRKFQTESCALPEIGFGLNGSLHSHQNAVYHV